MRPWFAVLLILTVPACKKIERPAASQPAAPAPTATAPGTSAPSIQGKVLERIDAAPYSYLRLDTGAGEVWAAVPQTTVQAGQQVAIAGPMAMEGFESKTLNRKFDKVYFGTLGDGRPAGAPGPAAPAPMAGARPPAGVETQPTAAELASRHAGFARSGADVGDLKVAKAEGPEGHTVVEVFEQKASLKGKNVAVRGKVVKFTPGVMGLNWVHLRDGTGSAQKANDDLAVTTNDTVAVGDVVVARGVVRTDKDFGTGYVYPVIVQEAKVAK